jgi:predicted MFS family arabinose efflux permease
MGSERGTRGRSRGTRRRIVFVALAFAVPMGVAASGAAEASPPTDPAAARAVAAMSVSHANEVGARMAGYLFDHHWA